MDKKLSIWGTYTCDPIKPYLEYCLQRLSAEFSVKIEPYNQIFQALLSEAECEGIGSFLIRFQDWGDVKGEDIDLDLVQKTTREFIELLEKKSKNSFKIVVISPSSPVFQEKHAHFFEGIEDKLTKAIESAKMNVLCILSKDILKKIGDYYDEYSDKEASMPYTPEIYAKIATLITRRIFCITNIPPKVAVLDCDNTLWRGVCGEDGPENVEVTPNYQYLQSFFKRLVSRGLLLCISSKNYEEDVRKVFKTNPNMILTLDDFVSHRINWQPKSKNILSMSKELNLHIKDFVFVDDNPVECAEVSYALPDITTLNLPKEEERIPEFLGNVWQLDFSLNQTEEDKSRTKMYKIESLRNQMKSEVSSLNKFIEGLNLKVILSKVDSKIIPRISQLTYRVNQFNLTGKKYSEAEFEEKRKSDYGWHYIHVSDKFGDYGISGALLYTIIGSTAKICELYLSCRVLGRGVEQKILSQIASIGKNNKALYLQISYAETGRNKAALDFLKFLGNKVENHYASKKTLHLKIEQVLSSFKG